MSDLHFTGDGDVLGHDPRVRLEAAIDHVNQHHADADFCVVSGDMVNRGTQDDYAALFHQSERLRIPLMPMVGNHDDRGLFRRTFSLPDTCMDDFVQYTVTTQDGIVVCLDTQKIGSDAGAFCAVRLSWLQNVLEDAGGRPVYIFMHHPPMSLSLPMQDTDQMEDGHIFLDLVSQYDCVKYLFIGHVHRPISGTVRSIPFSTMRSVLYQAPAPRPAWDWDSFKPSDEAPNLGVITIREAGVNLQFEQFCRFEHGARARQS